MEELELGLQARAAGSETLAADPAVIAVLERKRRRFGRSGVSGICPNRTTPDEVRQGTIDARMSLDYACRQLLQETSE